MFRNNLSVPSSRLKQPILKGQAVNAWSPWRWDL